VNVAVAADLVLLALIVVTAIAAVTTRSLLAASMLLGVYSLLVAATWVGLHSPDVAFTEAAVGAGVSTVVLLAALVRTGWREKPARERVHWPALAACLLVGGCLILGTADLPSFGDPESAANAGIGRIYLLETEGDTHVPNVVTAVLASYRGYDTMYETAVIFTAGAAVLLLLRSKRPKPGESEAGR
jgi:multicomponent Na+:H+ antiporter subunit B